MTRWRSWRPGWIRFGARSNAIRLKRQCSCRCGQHEQGQRRSLAILFNEIFICGGDLEENMQVYRGILLALFVTGPALAQEVSVSEGSDLYRTYCWQCHGFEATGDGPMAEMLAIRTPDLTKLAGENDGVFPIVRIAEQIDGRSQLLAHGGEMPIFGAVFETDQQIAVALPNGQPMMAGLPLANLLAFLESIQAD
ncbi:cytochrome c [Ruegeria sp. THAF33]|uniref:c-type cytochrome n=1 Tax=Ruegeria sp. THAF33 TaxID=2587853 RepID=UPI00352A5134